MGMGCSLVKPVNSGGNIVGTLAEGPWKVCVGMGPVCVVVSAEGTGAVNTRSLAHTRKMDGLTAARNA